MKHKIIKATIFYAIVFTCLSLMGCKAKKPIIIEKIVQIENSDYSRVKSELARSKAVNDSLFISIANIRTTKPECDSICQDALDRIMQNLNSKKTSGGNNFGVYYDRYKKQVVAYANLEETVSQFRDSVTELKRSKSEKIEIPVPVPYAVAAEFSKEQKINLWTGRLFWIVIFAYIGFKVYKKISVWRNLKNI